jgi:hypothetical protein
VTSIFEATETALATLTPSVPAALDKFIMATDAALPDVFIEYFLVSGVGLQHADDAETARRQRMQISIWSRLGLANLPDIDTAMIGQGFTPGDERQLESDPDTGHFGWSKDFFYLVNKEL